MSDRENVVALAKQGIPPRDIARILERPYASVKTYVADARRAGTYIPDFRTLTNTRKADRDREFVGVSRAIWDALAPHAEVRSIRPSQLITMILDAVAHDQLVNAILDDGEGAQDA